MIVVILGVLYAAAGVAVLGAGVVAGRYWLRPSGRLHVRRYVVLNAVMGVAWLGFGVANLIKGSWGWAACNLAMLLLTGLATRNKVRGQINEAKSQ